MSRTRSLTEDEFKVTMTPKMIDASEAEGVVDIWSYVERISKTDLAGHVVYDQFVESVYRSEDARYDHVLVMTKTRNVYLTVVVDLANETVYGHRLLDLNREYGLGDEKEQIDR